MKVPTLSRYTVQARIAPALLAVLPVLALVLALVPALPGAQRLWGLVSFPVTVFASLMARARGNDVQAELWQAWGGSPTTRRLRYRGAASVREVERRHRDVEAVVGGGINLPTTDDEGADARAADAEYEAATRRLIGCVRQVKGKFPLVDAENRNYGFARNLLGLRHLGRVCCVAALVLSAALAVPVAATQGAGQAASFLLPALAGGVMLGLWPMVTGDFVRLHGEAYADRLFEAAQVLAQEASVREVTRRTPM